jgi:ketopantoate reductase
MSMAKHWSAWQSILVLLLLFKGYQLFAKAQCVDCETSISIPRHGDRLLHSPEFLIVMLHDLERGNRLELDSLSGHVVKLGRERGIATPANEAVYKVLKLHRMGRLI